MVTRVIVCLSCPRFLLLPPFLFPRPLCQEPCLSQDSAAPVTYWRDQTQKNQNEHGGAASHGSTRSGQEQTHAAKDACQRGAGKRGKPGPSSLHEERRNTQEKVFQDDHPCWKRKTSNVGRTESTRTLRGMRRNVLSSRQWSFLEQRERIQVEVSELEHFLRQNID